MSVRATPVAKSVPMCTAPTSAIAAVDSSLVTLMAFHVKVSSVVLQGQGWVAISFCCHNKHEQFHVIFLSLSDISWETVFNEVAHSCPSLGASFCMCGVIFAVYTEL